MKYAAFTKFKTLIFILFLVNLSLVSCKKKRHHLLEDVAKKVRHDEDTIGWSMILEEMHAVWGQRK